MAFTDRRRTTGEALRAALQILNGSTPISIEADARLNAAILYILADVPRLETAEQRARVADDIADMIRRRGLIITADAAYKPFKP